MSENEETKKPPATEVIANLPRRDNYAPDKGSGNPYLQPGELQTTCRVRQRHQM